MRVLSSWCMVNAHELDGALIGTGTRLARVGLVVMLNFAYARLVDGADEEGRKRIDLALAGRIGESGGEIIDDPDLPEAMQGIEAPSWWNSDHDPFSEQHTLGGTDAKFHGSR